MNTKSFSIQFEALQWRAKRAVYLRLVPEKSRYREGVEKLADGELPSLLWPETKRYLTSFKKFQ